MRVFLDACVLFPTVLREVLIGLAPLYRPLWSGRVLEEWRRAASDRLGADAGAIAAAEIAVLRDLFGDASDTDAAEPDGPARARLAALETMALPDEGDRHVIASAIAGGADIIVTENRRDFPARVMRQLDLRVISPDEFIAELARRDQPAVIKAARETLQRARDLGGDVQPRALFKRARLPRLARLIAAQGGD
ncbi:MAG: PIN domain-containing protein [Paracoccus sp. (in: a-proteobacteria)]|nr:PIN domain-containing protein [Paracoccus sp. (in: a-proteobacteria)]